MLFRLFAPLCVAVAGCLGLAAQAQTVRFEGPSTLLFAGESYTENGFVFTPSTDFATIDTAAGFFLATPPSGNATSFLSVLNDGALEMTSLGGAFTVAGLDAGFIGPLPVDPGTTSGFLLLFGLDVLGNSIDLSFDLGPAGADGSFAFRSIDLGSLGPLLSLTLQACVLDGPFCFNPADNLAQFAIDNIQVAAIPEPETVALLAAGLAALAVRTRRRRAAQRVEGALA